MQESNFKMNPDIHHDSEHADGDSDGEIHATESSPLVPKSLPQPLPQTLPDQQNKKTPNRLSLHIHPKQQQNSSSSCSLGITKGQATTDWPTPAGLPPRDNDDESLLIFRRAIGINYNLAATDAGTMEEGRRKAVGMYRAVIDARRRKAWQYHALWAVVIFCHFAQILLGASLTALGPLANSDRQTSHHGTMITVLGATNTVIAGVLALVSGQGVLDRIQKDEMGYRKIQDWIEETESLLSLGVLGKNRKEVGLLVEEAFKRYNVAKSNEDNNRPSSYVNAPEEPSRVAAENGEHVMVAAPVP